MVGKSIYLVLIDMKDLRSRFALYLKDVVKYYKRNGSLRKFSALANKHRITSLPQELFFKYRLDSLADDEINEKLSDIILKDIYSRRVRREQKKRSFEPHKIISWVNNDTGKEAVAYTDTDGMFYFAVGYGSKDELWVCDEIPTEADEVTFTDNVSKEALLKFMKAVCYSLASYIEEERG